jgi:CheY-like chemotaxis protein
MTRRVLIVDDDPAIRLVTKRLLKNMKYEPMEARDGLEGERIAIESMPDLILLDIMMPMQDGYETCARLRAKGFEKPILLFSALLRENERGRARSVGANGYIQKPITQDELRRYLDSPPVDGDLEDS